MPSQQLVFFVVLRPLSFCLLLLSSVLLLFFSFLVLPFVVSPHPLSAYVLPLASSPVLQWDWDIRNVN